ncbi:aminoglycoside phosphotransferase family protein [Paenibacillus protaetiae]|uniref:Aminoglycoside phosphotransferase family protein n=1 Tax=Paenibacillus protaetiae TaxID=2509456 RepID=A0A4P6ET54_9BACL|nr:aminoglycoside phosphotransferase family protein [Paenibacillus protaetiae]QAY65786.1 aminoglycoside phosphotransferase family protein [Paenibacillus protaetiae]
MNNQLLALAERIAADYLQEKVIASYPIIGKGFVNQVVAVQSASRKLVIRMNDLDTYPVIQKEQWCIKQATEAGIPGPQVLDIGTEEAIAYIILSFVEGENGVDSTADPIEVWRQLGQYVKRIQSIPVQGYGEQLKDPLQGRFVSPPHAGSDGSWQGYVQYNMNSLTEEDRLIGLGVMTWEEAQQIHGIFSGLLQQSFVFGLAHGDLSLQNIMVSPAGQVILLDWGSAEVGVMPYGDILLVMQASLKGGKPSKSEFQAFMEGRGLNEDDLPLLMPLLLLRSFDTLRWAIDRCPERIEEYAAFARQVVKMINISETNKTSP